jgi:hypothetical protein
LSRRSWRGAFCPEGPQACFSSGFHLFSSSAYRIGYSSERRKPAYSKNRLLFTACLGAFMATMDTSLVSVGLPQIASFMETSVAAVSWVMVAYLLANASLQMVVGRLADLAAPRRCSSPG